MMDLAERVFQMQVPDRHGFVDHVIPYDLLTRWAPGTWLDVYEFIDYATFLGGLI